MKKKSANIRFPIAKVKKLVQKNQEVGKLTHSIPFLLSKSLEYFLIRMLTELAEKHKGQKVKLTPSHLKALIQENPKYSFLEFIMQDVSDLEHQESGKKKPDKEKGKQLKKRAPKRHKDSSSEEDDDLDLSNMPEDDM